MSNAHLPVYAKQGNLTEVKNRIVNGADVNVRYDYDQTLLHIAAQSGHFNIVEYLLARGADRQARDHIGRVPLHSAAQTNSIEIAALLIDMGVDVNVLSTHPGPGAAVAPLHIAAEWGQAKMVAYLLSRGANPNLKSRDGSTALHKAASGGFASSTSNHVSAAQVLLAVPQLDIFARDHGGDTALRIALRHGEMAGGKYEKIAALIRTRYGIVRRLLSFVQHR